MVSRSHSGHIRRIVTVSDAEGYSQVDRVNRTLSQASRIRLRLSVSAGLVEEGPLGLTGQAPIKASILADSEQLRQALRRRPERSLAVIIDDMLYQDVVISRLCGLRPEDYQRVVIRDKYRAEHVAWITVPGPVWSAPDGPLPRERLPPPPITAALIGAVAVIVAALITSAPGFFHVLGQSSTPTTFAPAAGTLRKEEAHSHPGTEVFRNSLGDAVADGPVSIPFGTQVWVKCWAPNESSMTGINDFYLVETSPWAGEYAPANAFLNADASGALDPEVPKCQASIS